MDQQRDLRNETRKFVIDALTEFSGKPPSKQVVETAVDNIVKAFSGVIGGPRPMPVAAVPQRKLAAIENRKQ